MRRRRLALAAHWCSRCDTDYMAVGPHYVNNRNDTLISARYNDQSYLLQLMSRTRLCLFFFCVVSYTL